MSDTNLKKGAIVVFKVPGRGGATEHKGTLAADLPDAGRAPVTGDNGKTYKPWVSQVQAA